MIENTFINLISTKDFFLAPLYLALILSVAFFYKSQLKKNFVLKKYLVPALLLRIFSGITLALLTQYYFKGGDTFYYYQGIDSIFQANFTEKLFLLGCNVDDLHSQGLTYIYFPNNPLMHSDSAYMVMKIGAIISMFTFNSYLSISLFFGLMSFLGCWMIFKVFFDLYPHLFKEIALVTLFIPSIFFWGSGVLKDPIAIAALGYFFHAYYFLFFKGKKIITNLLILLISAYLLLIVKVYVLVVFLPPLIFWNFKVKKQQIKNTWLRVSLGPTLVLIFLIIGAIGFSKISANINVGDTLEMASAYSKYYDKINETNLRHGKAQYSNYNLGEFEPSLTGVLKKVPQGINVTLFRPYVWEVRKIINVPAAFESLVILLFTLYVILKVKFLTFFQLFFKNPNILFCMFFGLLFAAIVGISTANFGTLVRYKIPCIPFYMMGLVLILDAKRQKVLAAQYAKMNQRRA